MIKVAVLVLNYNGRKHLAGFLSAAEFLQDDPTAEVVVVDNASCDDSLALVAREYPWVRIVRNHVNYGWGEGYNQAIQTLTDEGAVYSHYMFINNDVFPTKAWYDRLIAGVRAAGSKVGEIGCRAVFATPFIIETLYEVAVEDRDSIDVRLSSATDHDTLFKVVDRGRTKLDVRSAARSRNMPGAIDRQLTAAERTSRCWYSLLTENKTAKPRALQLTADFHVVRSVPITGANHLVIVKKGSGTGSQEVIIPPYSRLVTLRLVDLSEPLNEIVQNSGVGINSKFEGFDLHCYLPKTVAQNRVDLVGICGVCKIVTREAFTALGGFDPHYFMYYEDLDFSLRLKAKGYQQMIIEDAYLRHVHAGSSQNRSMFFERQVAWSRYYFQFRHAGWLTRLRTWLSFSWHARNEGREDKHWMAATHAIARQKFQRDFGNRHYVLGPGGDRS